SGEVSGPLELTVHYDGKVTAYQASNNDKLVSQNFNGTFGQHPRINFTRIVPNGDSLQFSADVTYNASEDLEKDGTSTDLAAGKHFTRYEFSIDSDGVLNLTIKIHDGASTDSGGIN